MGLRSKRVAVAAVAALTAAVAGCGGDSSSGEKTLTVVMWGGSAQEAHVNSYITPWAEENGITVLQDQPTDYAKLRRRWRPARSAGGSSGRA